MALLYILTCLIALWGIASYFCLGEKFMQWYYGQWGHDYREFDARRFKIAHSVSIFLVGVSGLFAVGLGLRWLLLIMMLVFTSANLFLIMRWCKKKDSSSK